MTDSFDTEVGLVSSSGTIYRVYRSAAQFSGTITAFLDGGDAAEALPVIPLPVLTDETLKHICNCLTLLDGHRELASLKFSQVPQPFARYLEDLGDEPVCALFKAANYLDFKFLLECIAIFLAQQLSGTSAQQMRRRFGIIDDFSDEERQRILEESVWHQPVNIPPESQ
eukprot:gnl/Hemi2/20541_TR6815_c0_g1_i1.p1 gnl/Hemi2/20541_TR6815_c0_g1~~gnl/Hemi2/20541_TR6815_c0_g1_i1.p1  ORF type:complete len:179 (-),score=27.98 gnl/Hemi2/20541_TR6815_c0_g1_i1:58-564(-)